MDHSRVNEFGFSGDMLDEAEHKKISGDGGDQAKAVTSNSSPKVKSSKAKKTD